jgi:uncharacterized protein YbjT (DUF2867 family)
MILVTGATGNVGRQLVRQLLEKNIGVRVLSRDPREGSFPAGVEVIAGDAGQPAALREALSGVDRMFFMSPTRHLIAQAVATAEAARRSGLRHIVMLSSLAVEMPEDNPLTREHAEAERIIQSSACAWTMLRAGVFATNTLPWASSIKSEGTVRNVLTNDSYAPIDPYDIAAVAATTLTEPGHTAKHYGLTGEESITPREQVAVLGELLGREIRYIELSFEEALPIFVRNFPVDGESTLRSLRLPNLPWAAPRGDVRQVTGKRPRSYRQWAESNLDAFRV